MHFPHFSDLQSIDRVQLVLFNILSSGYLLTISVAEVQTAVAVVVGVSLVALNAFKMIESRARRRESDARTRAIEESGDADGGPQTPDNEE